VSERQAPAPTPARVYYNSACPVCNAGIKDQRRRMQACAAEAVEWIDVHHNPGAVREVGADLETVRETLHVMTADGRIAKGADAFAALWSRTRGQRRAAALLRLPLLHGLSQLAYRLFARALYRWNRHRGHW
jgi:predicted DCC family thiol-disulfide oxidoreductase YuxK